MGNIICKFALIYKKQIQNKTSFNQFVPNAPFLYPLKTSENQLSGGHRKGELGTNGLIITFNLLGGLMIYRTLFNPFSALSCISYRNQSWLLCEFSLTTTWLPHGQLWATVEGGSFTNLMLITALGY